MPIDTGDTAWLLVSSALVLIMTPGLAFFYGGLVRRKNTNAVIMQCFACMLLVSTTWVLYGYSMAFGPDVGGLIGNLDWAGLNGVGLEPNEAYAATVPHQAFMIFQAMFAIITPALIIGAIADRMKFSAFMIFLLLWVTVVYSPIAHWVWAVGGWIRGMGALDFAGGTVVHINAGAAALVGALYLGKRRGFGKDPMLPHNIPFVVLGTGLLWFGWFGFNAGSALASGALATSAFVVTHTATAVAGLTWLIIGWLHKGNPSLIGACTGAVAGLVAITPASGFVDPLSSVVIGVGAGAFCYAAVQFKNKKGFDDALDVWGVHGIGGTWGAIATGLFAQKAINSAGADGLFFGNAAQMIPQIIGVAATWGYSIIVTFVILFIINKTIGLRVKPEEEAVGLDLGQHAEEAYVD